MSSAPPRRIKSFEELTAEENERLKSLREAGKGPVKMKDIPFRRVIIACILVGLLAAAIPSLSDHPSLLASVATFFAAFAIFFLLLLTILLLGPRSSV